MTDNIAKVALPAATVVLVRDAPDGYEVLLLQRNHQSAFVPGQYLFPGGGLDPDDAHPELCALCHGMDDAAASRRIGIPEGGLAYWTAAIRESFEEAGVILAYNDRDELVTLAEPELFQRYATLRSRMDAGEITFTQILKDEGLRLATDRLVYFANWITPAGAVRRYDTKFFIAHAPEGQEVLPDNRELIHHLWLRPSEALAQFKRGEIKMRRPTAHTLKAISKFESADMLVNAMAVLPEVPAILPRVAPDGRRVLPGEPGYEELGEPGKEGVWRP
jgi:8-oxo-dGTP pyrophosphatase MutT (NUDIX family)